MKISFIGTGNVATHLAKAFYNKGINIHQIYSLHYKNAIELSLQVNAIPIKHLNEIEECDLLILAVKDDVIHQLVKEIKLNDTLIVHTSGSIDIDFLNNSSSNFGCIYPPQSFSKNKKIDISSVNFCLEGNHEKSLTKLKSIVKLISSNISELNSPQRQKLHLAAVFANNFSNYMFALANEICEEYNIDFKLLSPLIKETVTKLDFLSPYDAQTGPAARNDVAIIDKHLSMITDEKQKKVYELLSNQLISKYHAKL